MPALKQRAQQAAEAPAVEEAAEETDLERLSRIMGATVDSEGDVQYMQESDIPGDAALPDKLWARKYIQQSKGGGGASSAAAAAPAVKKAATPAPAKTGALSARASASLAHLHAGPALKSVSAAPTPGWKGRATTTPSSPGNDGHQSSLAKLTTCARVAAASPVASPQVVRKAPAKAWRRVCKRV